MQPCLRMLYLLQGYEHTFEQVEAELDYEDMLESLPQNVIDDTGEEETPEALCRYVSAYILLCHRRMVSI